jgi:hypothetical protein
MVQVFAKGLAIGKTSQAAIIDLDVTRREKKFKQPIPYDDHKHVPWSAWGEDNLAPLQMIEDIETCGILNAIIAGKARFALCQGIVPAITKRNEKLEEVIVSGVKDPEITSFLENNAHFSQTYGIMKDFAAWGWAVVRIMLDRQRKKIKRFSRADPSEVRISKLNDQGVPEMIYISAQWDRVKSNPKDERIISIPLLDPSNPLEDLKGRTSGTEFAIILRDPSWGRKYYPLPMWMAVHKWVKIAQGVPEMKAAMYENNIRLKYMVIIHEEYWSYSYGDTWANFTEKEKKEKREETYDGIDEFLAGSKNAYKSIFVDGKASIADNKVIPYIDIKPIEDTTKQGELLPDSAAANSEIAFAMLFNPSIIGASLPSGPYTNSQGGSNVREAVAMQVVIHEFERQMVRTLFNVIKHFNGWADKYPGLQFLIPATILTTLDTGASSKQVVTGAEAPKNSENAISE